jgi:Protein of unknown function (DUF2845)
VSARVAGLALCALAVAAGPETVAAQMRCGNKLIDVGMASTEVARLCGQPDSKTTEQQDVRAGNRVVGTTEVSRWTYLQGAVTRVLEFDRGKLVAIRIER